MGRRYSTPDPPPAARGHMCENEAALYTDATTYVEHVPLKEGGQLLQQITFFKQPFAPGPPPAAGSRSCQDRTQRCSLPVESIIVKHWRGITSAGGYKSEMDAMECHHQETSFPINF